MRNKKVGVGDGVGCGVVVGLGVTDGPRTGVVDRVGVSDSAGLGVVDGVGVPAPVDGAAQAARKSTSAMKTIAFLISLPFLFSDPRTSFSLD